MVTPLQSQYSKGTSDRSELKRKAMLNSWKKRPDTEEIFHFEFRRRAGKSYRVHRVYAHDTINHLRYNLAIKYNMTRRDCDVLCVLLKRNIKLSKREGYVVPKKSVFKFTAQRSEYAEDEEEIYESD